MARITSGNFGPGAVFPSEEGPKGDPIFQPKTAGVGSSHGAVEKKPSPLPKDLVEALKKLEKWVEDHQGKVITRAEVTDLVNSRGDFLRLILNLELDPLDPRTRDINNIENLLDDAISTVAHGDTLSSDFCLDFKNKIERILNLA